MSGKSCKARRAIPIKYNKNIQISVKIENHVIFSVDKRVEIVIKYARMIVSISIQFFELMH